MLGSSCASGHGLGQRSIGRIQAEGVLYYVMVPSTITAWFCYKLKFHNNLKEKTIVKKCFVLSLYQKLSETLFSICLRKHFRNFEAMTVQKRRKHYEQDMR